MSDRIDLSLLTGSTATVRFALTRRNNAGVVGPYNLTGATVAVRVTHAEDGSVVSYTAAPAVVVGEPATEGIVFVRFDADDLAAGSWSYAVQATASGEDDPDVPAYGSLLVVDVLDPALGEIRRLIGNSVPPTDAELLADYARLGTAKKVALAVLERRYVEMLSRPASWALTGDYSEDWGSNIARMGEYLNGLRAEVQVDTGTGPNVLGVATLTRGGRAR